jgi:predicted short-subunit dehydrogenase-like oxidoreductase (DUF2520 family)
VSTAGTDSTLRVRIVGRGRAGGSFARALGGAGWTVETMGHESPRLADAAAEVDLVLLCVPDSSIAEVAAAVTPARSTVVAHCSGSRRLDVLAGHERRAAVHPLVALAEPEIGARRLQGAWFAVAGDPFARRIVESLGGRAVEVSDESRTRYHAAAVIASNHLVALLGQVERVAAGIGVPLEAFLDLARGALEDVAELGPTGALTGPVARGDHETVRAHLDALPADERPAYRAMSDAAAVLVGGRRAGADTGRPDPGSPSEPVPGAP